MPERPGRISRSSLYYEFDPTSIGWLHRRAKTGEDILNPDVARIIEADPDLIPDSVLREHVVRGLKGKLKARRGRKRTNSRLLKEFYILALYEELLPRLQARAKRKRRKGIRKARADYSPSEHAQALLGARLGMEPESVRNLISSRKNSKISR